MNAGSDFAALAEGHRRAGLVREAEQILHSGLADHPDCLEGLLVLALVLLEQERGEEARALLERWADEGLGVEIEGDPAQGEAFSGDVTDGEFEAAFDGAESEREQMLDADAIAQQAMREVDFDLAGEMVSPEASFVTHTVADLLEKQGDSSGAARIHAMVDDSTSATEDEVPVVQNLDRRSSTILQLERWLTNVRGGMQ
jgi:hypothetical protein